MIHISRASLLHGTQCYKYFRVQNMMLWRHSCYEPSVQEYYLVALAQQRPEEEPSLDMKSAVSTAMNKLVTTLCCSLKGFHVHINISLFDQQRSSVSCAPRYEMQALARHADAHGRCPARMINGFACRQSPFAQHHRRCCRA